MVTDYKTRQSWEDNIFTTEPDVHSTWAALSARLLDQPSLVLPATFPNLQENAAYSREATERFRTLLRERLKILREQFSPRLATAVFSRKLYAIPHVQSVHVNIGNDGVIHLWTLLDTGDEVAFDAVYKVELFMYDHYPQMNFDFYVIPLNLLHAGIDQIIPEGFVRLPRDLRDVYRRTI